MTSISRVTSRARQVGTVTSQSSVDLEAEPLEDRALLVRRDVEADEAVGALGPEADDRPSRQAGVDVGAARQLGAGEVDEEPAREHGRRLGEMGVDALLPAVRALRAQAEPLGGVQDPDRLEVRGLEQHLGRLVGDLALGAAHDRGESDGLVPSVISRSRSSSLRSVPSSVVQLLARLARPDDDPPAVELGRSKAWSGLP